MRAATRFAFEHTALCALIALGACGRGDVIALGARAPSPYHFGAPQLIEELRANAKTDNPTLTSDLLEIVFTTDRDLGNSDIWSARRASRAEPFGAPMPVTSLNSASFETGVALSGDGLTLWFGSDRPGGLGDLDILRSQRVSRDAAWSPPVHLTALNTPAKDVPRPVGEHERVMPMASDRERRGTYQVYFAARTGPDAEFATPELLETFSYPQWSTVVDGFLSDDGLTLFFCGAKQPGPTDLFVTWRKALDEPFEDYAPLSELNSPNDELDPWLSPDGTELYFSSNRSGFYNIYRVEVQR